MRVLTQQAVAGGGPGDAERVERVALARPAFRVDDRRQPALGRAPCDLGHARRPALVERPRDALLGAQQEGESDRLPFDVGAEHGVDALRR